MPAPSSRSLTAATSSTCSATSALRGTELEAERVGLHDREREVAGLVLGGRHVPPLLDERQAERLAVELRGAVVVCDLEGDEVDAGDE